MLKLKKVYNTIKKYENFVGLTVGLTLLILGLSIFFIGFHNFDLGQNFEFIDLSLTIHQLENNQSSRLEFYETTLGARNIYDFKQMYKDGLILASDGVIFILLGAILIGYGLRDYRGALK